MAVAAAPFLARCDCLAGKPAEAALRMPRLLRLPRLLCQQSVPAAPQTQLTPILSSPPADTLSPPTTVGS